MHVDDQEIFEAAILFTDLRGSSGLVTRTSTREYFRILNASLSAQAKVVRAHGGELVKYTGDGLMAVFRGDERRGHALRCARALANPVLHSETGFGIGLAEGRVLAGLVGDPEDHEHAHREVVGATVHLAARLCAQAEAGEAIATRRLVDASGLSLPVRASLSLRVSGFAGEIDCVAIQA
jgi:adenylate cyclase